MKVYLLITDGDSIEVTAYASRKAAEHEAWLVMRSEMDGNARELFDEAYDAGGYEEAESVYEDCLAAGSLYVRVDEAEVQG